MKKSNEKAVIEKAAKKKLLEMNLLDDFLFGSVVTYPEIGQVFVKELLRIIFDREFNHLSVTAQKMFYGADPDLHGARLDVYLEPEIEESFTGTATVYDMEPDQNDSAANIAGLPRRVRFYHGKIAMGNLKSGRDYNNLKNAVIIMIIPYDPFGLGHMVYTVKNTCLEVPEMKYEDGASTLFLYTRGENDSPDERLKQLLHYMEVSTYENAVNDDLRRIHEMVETVKRDPETSIKYLRLLEKLNQSKKEGELKGYADGELIGKTIEKITQVCKKMRLHQSLEKIAEDLVEEVSVIEPIYRTAQKFAPDYDPQLVFEQMQTDRREIRAI